MEIKDLRIVIENLRGSYKKFADSLEEYPILGVTYPTHYGYIEGFIGEDGHDLDVFVGNGHLNGYIKVSRDDAQNGVETKMFVQISEQEYEEVLQIFKPVIIESRVFKNDNEFLSFLNLYLKNDANIS
jgi:hypothetical protein